MRCAKFGLFLQVTSTHSWRRWYRWRSCKREKNDRMVR